MGRRLVGTEADARAHAPLVVDRVAVRDERACARHRIPQRLAELHPCAGFGVAARFPAVSAAAVRRAISISKASASPPNEVDAALPQAVSDRTLLLVAVQTGLRASPALPML